VDTQGAGKGQRETNNKGDSKWLVDVVVDPVVEGDTEVPR